MTKQEILDYKVIPDSKKAKDMFNAWLKNDKIQIIGDFKNEHGELFVVYKTDILPNDMFWITGDEIGWEIGMATNYQGEVFSPFLVNSDEREAIVKILKKAK